MRPASVKLCQSVIVTWWHKSGDAGPGVGRDRFVTLQVDRDYLDSDAAWRGRSVRGTYGLRRSYVALSQRSQDSERGNGTNWPPRIAAKNRVPTANFDPDPVTVNPVLR